MGVVEDLARAREAYRRREWIAAYDALSGTDTAELDADDFERLATAAYLLGHRNDCVQALQRAHQANLDQGRTVAAARSAFWLAFVLLTGGEAAVGGGWVARCQRLLDEVEEDVVERGYLLVHLMFRHVFAAEYAEAQDLAVRVLDYGRRFHDPDLLAHGLMVQGRLAIYAGRVPAGLALLDDAMVGIALGEVSPVFAGEIYCSMIEACQEIGDLGRAAEWTSALTGWIDEQPGLVPFTGQCAVHRGQILRIHGDLTGAVEEFSDAVERYLAADTVEPAGLAMQECADVLRVLGDLDGAREAYDRAISFGHDPQPGLALLWLATGRVDAALAAVHRMLAEPRDVVHRAQLLPAAIDTLLATDHADEAAALSPELARIADAFGCAALEARAAFADAAVRIASGDPVAGVGSGRRALRTWQALGAPYEAARCRLLVGRALRALGDPDSAEVELVAARRAFAELGARPAEREVAALLQRTRPGGLTEREVEVLRLVASGKTNPEIAAALVLSEKTVARHLSNIFVKVEVSSRTAAAAFAFEHHLA